MESGITQRIFIVEDNDWYQKLLVHTVSLNPDYEVEAFSTGKDLLARLNSEIPDLITMDYRLPDISGEELLEKIKSVSPPGTQVIVISEQEEIETAVSLLKLGAYDYIVKGNDIRNRLLNTLSNAQNQTKLLKKIEKLEQEVQTKYNFSDTIIGQSSKMQHIFMLLQKAVSNNITVSITGETGTGKEVIAKAIHYNSIYKDKPFVAINVAAIPKELFESELFGHEKGSFTGANQTRIGKFEEADGGTLFLDEIAELDPVFQAKLLRALQEREITRVGGNKVYKFNCRIIVATHKNLLQEVKAGNFREDLYYRLFGLPIELPPLREREKDTLLLSKSFVERFCKENGMEVKKISPAAQNKLLAYPWPGNIRELKSVMELAAVMSMHDVIEADDIVVASADILSGIIAEEMSLRAYNRKIVQLFLDKYSNNTKLVAEKLDIGQTTIYRMLKEEEED
ncbi:sigma-54 dependent transcriptional regulator [Fluviicola sp.]|uniref:sigma-54-dependent transcriptional regulator n=1 Tax=Fluviicola sp. TaxID=1917219 RepID=UPI0031E37FEE